ncbi:hypothetical protein AP75_13565 [Kaistella haifensis DSM 19056]|uniref:Uncharacterized protein n=1 Tax=Kaistella haifensis DSM 19056 TaxID=1450526 RepID=A0A246B6J2_9FLAO|nr:hypothetical protein AP75_13565 [Kaistella haifensis DSM 19056]
MNRRICESVRKPGKQPHRKMVPATPLRHRATFLGKLPEKSGWKDSGMYGGKKMLFGGVFSTRHKHITTRSL